MKCTKCQLGNTYFQDGQWACLMCEERFPKIVSPGRTPEIPSSDVEKQEKERVKDMAERKCRNCGREQKIIGDGLCSGCYWKVYKKFTKGTPGYDAALVEAKKQFTDPDYKAQRGGSRPHPKKTEKPIKENLKAQQPENSIVGQLINARNILQDKIFKINQAIELLKETVLE